jgi:hypothetical protein
VALLNLRSVVPQATFFSTTSSHHRDVGSGTSKPIIPNFKSAATSFNFCFSFIAIPQLLFYCQVAKLLLFFFNENPNFLFEPGSSFLYLSDKI